MEGDTSHFIDLGKSDYLTAHRLQLEWVEKVINGQSDEVILLTEHHPVYTCGRATLKEDRPITDIPLVDVERGGKLTYHGPGQLVAYPILNLGARKMGVVQYLRNLEECVIHLLNLCGLRGERRDEFLAGVWLHDRKICSIGIALKRWVSYHGLALNVTCNLAPFRACRPCGLEGSMITSFQEIGCQVDIDHVKRLLQEELNALFFPKEK